MVPLVLEILELVRDQLQDHLDIEYYGESSVEVTQVKPVSVRALVCND